MAKHGPGLWLETLTVKPSQLLFPIPVSANSIPKMESEGIDLNTDKIREWRSIVTLIVFVITSESDSLLAGTAVPFY